MNLMRAFPILLAVLTCCSSTPVPSPSDADAGVERRPFPLQP